MTFLAKAIEPAAIQAAEARIVKNAHRYELAALIAELRGLNYTDDAIEFRSNNTVAHQTSLVASVVFEQSPRRALVSVNLSLLSPQSPLPTYFQQAYSSQDGPSLTEFLNFFSHRMVRTDVLGMFPERDPSLFEDFSTTKRQLRCLLGMRAPSTAHWVFQSYFPELEVCVRRTTLERPVRTRGMVLSQWMTGDGSVLGGLAKAPVSALAITLFCDEPETGIGDPWAREADRRLREEIFPLLQSHGLFLEITLVFRDQSTFMVLAPNQFLGYEPLNAGALPPPPPFELPPRISRSVILFSGEVPVRNVTRRT